MAWCFCLVVLYLFLSLDIPRTNIYPWYLPVPLSSWVYVIHHYRPLLLITGLYSLCFVSWCKLWDLNLFILLEKFLCHSTWETFLMYRHFCQLSHIKLNNLFDLFRWVSPDYLTMYGQGREEWHVRPCMRNLLYFCN